MVKIRSLSLKKIFLNGETLCKWGFHKWPTEDAIKTMAILEGRDPYPLIRTCMRECGRKEEHMDSSQGYWWSIREHGIQKYEGPDMLKAIVFLPTICYAIWFAIHYGM